MAEKLHIVFYVNEEKGQLKVTGRGYNTGTEALYAFAETPCIWSDINTFDTLEEVKKAMEELQEECNNPIEFYEKYGEFM